MTANGWHSFLHSSGSFAGALCVSHDLRRTSCALSIIWIERKNGIIGVTNHDVTCFLPRQPGDATLGMSAVFHSD